MNRQISKLVLARHGETEFNRNRIIMGHTDSQLTQDGIRVAAQVAGLVAKEEIEVVFSSPLGRAQASARLYTANAGLTVATEAAMAELACGEWEGRHKLEVKPDPLLIRDTWDDRPPGGESYRDAEQRVSRFIDKIRRESSLDHILVVGHAGVNRVFLKLWLGLKSEDAIRIRCPHDTIFVLDGDTHVEAKSLSEGTIDGLLMDHA